MSYDTRAKKRKRTQSAPESPAGSSGTAKLPELKHHDSLWFDDGNIILRAGVMLFRVHKGILAWQSDVLKGIVSDLQVNGLETVDGCPIVVLPDEPRDMATLLEAMYDPKSLIMGDVLPFETVSAYLRLGTKYGVENLRHAALSILRSCYPSTLEDLEKIDRFDPAHKMVWTQTQDYQVALLARDLGLDDILVVALYQCCSIQPWELMHRLGLDEGPGRPSPRPDIPFDRETMQKLFRGRSELVRQGFTHSLGFLDGTPSKTCENHTLSSNRCRRRLNELSFIAHRVGLLVDNACALDCQDDFIDEATKEKNICEPCLNDLKKRHQEGRRKVWGNLYMIFRVPEELQD